MNGSGRSPRMEATAAYQTRVHRQPLDLLRLHEHYPQRYPFLLESVARSSRHRHDILFAFPGETLRLKRNLQLTLSGRALASDFFSAWHTLWMQHHVEPQPHAWQPPFRGGWFFFLAYELAQSVEPTLRLTPDEHLPTAMLVRVPAAIVQDHQAGTLTLVAENGYESCLEQMQRDIAALPPVAEQALFSLSLEQEPDARYLDAVARIKEYILDGDVFQVNLSRLWRAASNNIPAAAAIYRRLRQSNPAPFAALAQLDGVSIISSSPERLVRVDERRVESRPIAGTRARGQTAILDHALAKELLLHPKELAEHIMLIDLERNDLGRICRPGTVEVNELLQLESYTHVHHIVSNVRGQLREDVTPESVLRAVFPGGTITGCPKVRTMEIIAELEGCARGAYTGGLGYLNRDGDLDCNILIRTMVCTQEQLWFRTGAGIVADSDPLQELAETRAKAKGLCLAIS